MINGVDVLQEDEAAGQPRSKAILNEGSAAFGK